MADPLDSHNIARKSFEVGRKGYEQQEVRAFLHEVSSLVERMQREGAELRERAERAESRLELADKPDEAMLIEVLGEETTRVLTSAREAAGEIKAKAEAAAERIVSEATAEAADTRSSAQRDADRRLAEATSDSEALLSQARSELERRSAEAEEAAARIREEATAQAQDLRDQGSRDLADAEAEAEAVVEASRVKGKEMVAEAQVVRERILRDLAARRKKARQQVEKLNAGRERLLEAYDVVRRTVDEATTELQVSLSDARLAADAAVRRMEDEAEPTLEELDAEVSTAALVDLPIAELVDDDSPGPFSGEVPVVEPAAETAVEPVADDPVPSEPEAAPAPPVALDERRGRKGRRRKDDFSGLPAGELVRVEPPAHDEGIRILAEPATSEPEPEAEPDATSDGEASATEATEEQSAAAESPAEPDAEPATDAEPDADSGAEPEADPGAADDDAESSIPAGESETASEADVEADDEDASRPQVDDVFARLRAEQGTGDDPVEEATAAGDVAEPREPDQAAEPEEADDADAAAFTARGEALEPIERELARRLKRTLADEQNEVLDLLRRAKPAGVDDLLPSVADHRARWSQVADESLAAAAAAGAGWAGGEAGPVDALTEALAEELTGPLRDRIDRSFAASDGNLDDVADRVRALYREWKGQRLAESARHHVTAAYARGAFDALPADATVRWAADPAAPACVDCDDNILAGAIAKGEGFPTGGPCAPAHPGCRCLVLAATG
ncbi:MAG: DivIVA domain-containing protein [Acidimicrobiales bacterium]